LALPSADGALVTVVVIVGSLLGRGVTVHGATAAGAGAAWSRRTTRDIINNLP
jgi:hypothetical protein